MTFAKLSVSFARARLPNDSALEDGDYFPLKDYTAVRRVPVERQHDGLWVTGPRPGLLLYPPLFYGFATEWGWLLANIWTTWSPIWTVPGSELESALRQMVTQGWQPYDVPRDFSL